MFGERQGRIRRPRSRSGHAVIEASLLAPWILFLFVGVFDFGFYAYAAISTQNAARIAALQTSDNSKTAGDSNLACRYALIELQTLPGVGPGRTPPCPSSPSAITNQFPVAVLAQAVTGPDGASATRVSVTYRTVQLVPIPGLLTGRLTLTRVVEMRVKEL